MTLRELQYLVELARLQNFRLAAEVCGVSQPTLSTQIRKLEQELGVALVERIPRRVTLTPAGEEITARARRILSEVRDIHDIADRARAPESGRLRLGAFPTLGPYLLPLLVPRIARSFPRMELQLVEEKTETLIERLHDGQIDAALLALPLTLPAHLPDTNLQIAPLFDEPFLLALPPDHPLAAQDRVTSDQLHNQRLMLLEDGHCLRDQALSLCQRWGAQETSGFRATSLETLRQMVGAGMGITLLPQLATRGPLADSGNLRFLPFADQPAPMRSIGLVWRRSSAMTPVMDKLARLVRDCWDSAGAKPVAGPKTA